jgi:hypothetical protein
LYQYNISWQTMAVCAALAQNVLYCNYGPAASTLSTGGPTVSSFIYGKGLSGSMGKDSMEAQWDPNNCSVPHGRARQYQGPLNAEKVNSPTTQKVLVTNAALFLPASPTNKTPIGRIPSMYNSSRW